MTDKVDSPGSIRLATASAVISSAGAVIAAICAILSTGQQLKAVKIDVQEKVFAKKLDACDAFAETENAINTNPMIAASINDQRTKMILTANRLSVLFSKDVQDRSLKFVNKMDIIYAANHGGPQSAELNLEAGALMQSANELETACQQEIRSIAQG